jgi:hypothetical protein
VSIRLNKETQHLETIELTIGLFASWQHVMTISMSKR